MCPFYYYYYMYVSNSLSAIYAPYAMKIQNVCYAKFTSSRINYITGLATHIKTWQQFQGQILDYGEKE